MTLQPYLDRVIALEHLSVDEAEQAMDVLFSGEATAAQTAGFLVALRMKGESAEELAGFARSMRAHMLKVDAGEVVDNCGTGGDASGTFNVSTTAAFVMAGAGARVAKHGNRSISSMTGAADVLEALGVCVTSSPEAAGALIRDVGIGFLFAPAFHPATKHVQPVRRELKVRTVFNLLGPLANPAGARSQVIGAPSAAGAELMAEAMRMLGAKHVFVVHGHGGLDEISTTGPTDVFEVKGGEIHKLVWEPEDFGVERAEITKLKGGDAVHNSGIVRAVLEGEMGPRREIVLVNAAAGLVVAGIASDLKDGMRLAAESIDSGAAWAKLGMLKEHCPEVGAA